MEGYFCNKCQQKKRSHCLPDVMARTSGTAAQRSSAPFSAPPRWAHPRIHSTPLCQAVLPPMLPAAPGGTAAVHCVRAASRAALLHSAQLSVVHRSAPLPMCFRSSPCWRVLALCKRQAVPDAAAGVCCVRAASRAAAAQPAALFPAAWPAVPRMHCLPRRESTWSASSRTMRTAGALLQGRCTRQGLMRAHLCS